MAAQSFPTDIKECTDTAEDCCIKCSALPNLNGTLSCQDVDGASQLIYSIGPHYCKFEPANGNDVAAMKKK